MNNQDRLIIEKEQLNDLVNSCQKEIRRLKEEIKIKDGINETTFKNLMEERKENQRLNNCLKKIKKYCVDNIYSDSCTELTSGKITDVGYCIDALEDILDILKELKESDK